MSKPVAATATTAVVHSNNLGKDNQEFCMSMWAAWRLRTIVEAHAKKPAARNA
ncbi:hypothetical protein [Donghicola sp. XS_ASV15]|uniref:hypothetical protein n=1 Tax=Donghicola sp. XS_ASV15 TaxID=3241295 RepID=UPI003511E3BC